MPNVFKKTSNILVRTTFIMGGVILASIIVVAGRITPYTHDLYLSPEQPAPFSHKHHAAQLGIDCRYCHTGVEETGFAGVPPTETCYTCHSQIWVNSPLLKPVRDSYETGVPIEWARVYNVPDFVYFDHSIHVAKGVSCVSCHGQIDKQNLTNKEVAMEMLWCLDCHRQPEESLRPLDKVFDMTWEAPANQTEIGKQMVKDRKINTHQIQNCSVCHR